MIPPQAISQAIRTSASFSGGPTYDLLCQAIGTSLASWLSSGLIITGVTAGIVGAGTITGSMRFSGVLPAVVGALNGAGLNGQTVQGLATGLVNGLNASLAALTYQGLSAGVATGTDVAFVSSVNTTTLAQTLRANHSALCAAQGGSGSSVPGLYSGIANAIGVILSTGIGNGVVTPSGPVGPSSSTGTSLSHPV